MTDEQLIEQIAQIAQAIRSHFATDIECNEVARDILPFLTAERKLGCVEYVMVAVDMAGDVADNDSVIPNEGG